MNRSRISSVICIILPLLCYMALVAEDRTWTGLADSALDNVANWDGGETLPTPLDRALFQSSAQTPFILTSGSDVEYTNAYFQTGETPLTLDLGEHTLLCTNIPSRSSYQWGHLFLQSRDMVLMSGTLSASFIQIGDSAENYVNSELMVTNTGLINAYGTGSGDGVLSINPGGNRLTVCDGGVVNCETLSVGQDATLDIGADGEVATLPNGAYNGEFTRSQTNGCIDIHDGGVLKILRGFSFHGSGSRLLARDGGNFICAAYTWGGADNLFMISNTCLSLSKGSNLQIGGPSNKIVVCGGSVVAIKDNFELGLCYNNGTGVCSRIMIAGEGTCVTTANISVGGVLNTCEVSDGAILYCTDWLYFNKQGNGASNELVAVRGGRILTSQSRAIQWGSGNYLRIIARDGGYFEKLSGPLTPITISGTNTSFIADNGTMKFGGSLCVGMDFSSYQHTACEGGGAALECRGTNPVVIVTGDFSAATNTWTRPGELRFAVPEDGFVSPPIVVEGDVILNNELIVRVKVDGLDTRISATYPLLQGNPNKAFTANLAVLNAHADLPRGCSLVLGDDNCSLALKVAQPGVIISVM